MLRKLGDGLDGSTAERVLEILGGRTKFENVFMGVRDMAIRKRRFEGILATGRCDCHDRPNRRIAEEAHTAVKEIGPDRRC